MHICILYIKAQTFGRLLHSEETRVLTRQTGGERLTFNLNWEMDIKHILVHLFFFTLFVVVVVFSSFSFRFVCILFRGSYARERRVRERIMQFVVLFNPTFTVELF